MNPSMKKTVLLLAVSLAVCFLFCGAEAEEKGRARMTLMIYMCGSDLETAYGSATQDLQEMLDSGAGGADIPILVLTGGSRRWRTGFDSEQLRLLEINRGRRRTVAAAEARSMGDPETLRNLISFAEDHYPADEYALIFWDHGNGTMEGLCFDEIYRPDRLSVQELRQVLEDSGFARKKLKWIGFDACLMGSAEVAAQLAPYAEYMIASEESEPGCGWDYLFLRGLEKDGSALETAKRLIDLYVSQDHASVRTLSCLDLSKADRLIEAVDGVFAHASLLAEPEDYSEVSRLRQMILSYGADVSRGMMDHDLVDMGQLVDSLPGLDEESVRSLHQAFSQAVVYRNSNIRGDSGVSVYFPFFNKSMYTDWISRYPLADTCPEYTEYIQRFGGMLTGRPFADWSALDMRIYLANPRKSIPSENTLESMTRLGLSGEDAGFLENLLPEEMAVESGILARTELSKDQQRDFLKARLLVLERFHTMFSAESQYRVIYSSPELGMDDTGTVRGVYPELTLHVVDGNGRSLASEVSYYYRENGDLAVNVIAGDSFSGEQRREIPMIMTFSPDETGSLVLRETFVYDELTENYTNRAAYDQSLFPYLIFPYQYILPVSGEDGDQFSFIQWKDSRKYNRETVIMNDGNWHLEFRDASGKYALALCMEITDTQNNRHISTLRTVDWGYSSRDLLYEHPNLRVIAENIQSDAEQIRLNLTLVSSELADFDLVAYGASVNGSPASFIQPSGSRSPCSEHIRLSKGEAFVHTLCFARKDSEPVSELDFKLALYYDASSEENLRLLENGNLYVSWGESEPLPQGYRWYFTERLRIQLPEVQAVHREVLSTDEMTVRGGNMIYGGSCHWADSGSASPLDSRLSGETHFSRILPENPELLSGREDITLCIGNVRREGEEYVMEVRQISSIEPSGEHPPAFLISERSLLLQSGSESLPVTLMLRGGKAVLDDIRFSNDQIGSGPARLQAEVGSSLISHIRWESGGLPEEILNTLQWNNLRARWTEGGKVTFTPVPEEMGMESCLLTVKAGEPFRDEGTALFADRNGEILMICPAADLVHLEPADRTDISTAVTRIDSAEGKEELYGQTDEWIWREERSGALLIRYIGASRTVAVPEHLGGLIVSGLANGSLSDTGAFDITIPHYGPDVNPYAFTGDTFRAKRSPDKGMLRIQSPAGLSSEEMIYIHERLGFAECIAPETQSVWAPPLIYRKTPRNEWEIISWQGREESVAIPESVFGLPVTAIGDSAFSNPSLTVRLRDIVIPEGITRFGTDAFRGSSLRSIVLPASLQEIGTGVLDSCNQLREVRIRCSLNLIEKDLFSNCVLLRRNPYGITLPENASEEEIEAFMDRVFPGLEPPLQKENEQEEKHP